MMTAKGADYTRRDLSSAVRVFLLAEAGRRA
jgi:hypothetical protein